MVIVEGRCTMARSSSIRSKLFIGWHKSIVSSDCSDTMVWFGQILLYLHFYHPVYIILDKSSLNIWNILVDLSRVQCLECESQSMNQILYSLSSLGYYFNYLIIFRVRSSFFSIGHQRTLGITPVNPSYWSWSTLSQSLQKKSLFITFYADDIW